MLLALIAINLLGAAVLYGNPLGLLNLFVAGFLAGLWAAQLLGRRYAKYN
jgi:hypothetical protein